MEWRHIEKLSCELLSTMGERLFSTWQTQKSCPFSLEDTSDILCLPPTSVLILSWWVISAVGSKQKMVLPASHPHPPTHLLACAPPHLPPALFWAPESFCLLRDKLCCLFSPPFQLKSSSLSFLAPSSQHLNVLRFFFLSKKVNPLMTPHHLQLLFFSFTTQTSWKTSMRSVPSTASNSSHSSAHHIFLIKRLLSSLGQMLF